MQASIASPMGTALIPTQGSCLPLTEIFVFFPFLSTVSLLLIIEDVGFTANDAIISCPEDIPPSIPPALLLLNFTFLDIYSFNSINTHQSRGNIGVKF